MGHTKKTFSVTETELAAIDDECGQKGGSQKRSEYLVWSALYVRNLGRQSLNVLRASGWTGAHILCAIDSLRGTFLGPPRIAGDVALALHDTAALEKAHVDHGIAAEDWQARVKEVRRPEIESALVTLSEIWPHSEGLRKTVDSLRE